MKTYEEIKKIKAKYEKQLLSIDGVNAIGLGYRKHENGEDELALLAYTTPGKKADLLKTEIISLTLNDVPVEIIEAPLLSHDILRTHKSAASTDPDFTVNEDQGRFRPLVGGIQLFLHDNKSAWLGTLGIFVKSQDSSDGKLYLLSNLHVLQSVGLSVFQPLNGNQSLIATTSIAKEFPDTDAALAQVDTPSDVALNIIQGIGLVDKIENITDKLLGKRVLKRGRTTGLTEGTVEAIHTRIFLSETQSVEDCVIVRADHGKHFSDSGDSGSPVILRDENSLTGLLFASDKALGGISCFCTMENVFRNLNVKLPTKVM